VVDHVFVGWLDVGWGVELLDAVPCCCIAVACAVSDSCTVSEADADPDALVDVFP